MILNDAWIKEFAGFGGIEPFSPESVNPASYDIGLGKDLILYQNAEDSMPGSAFPPLKAGMFKCDLSLCPVILRPGAKVLVCSQETVYTPVDVAITVRLKSSLGRQFIVAPMGLYVDPGYIGQLTFALINLGPESYELRLGRRVAQLIFNSMNAAAEIPYGDERRQSHYQGSVGVTANKSTL
jgi:dCTP deaminase